MKFYQTLNQAPRSAKQNGKHRRAGAPAHRRPAVRTDHSARGSDEDGTITVSWSTYNTLSTWSTGPVRKPEPPTVPYAGIRTGELIGYRLWWLIPERGKECLCSLAHRRLWEPGETITGNLNELVDSMGPIWGGTYAYSSPDPTGPELEYQRQNMAVYEERRSRGYVLLNWLWTPYGEAIGIVLGRIKMWGEVIEHEHGYRAEFAKLYAIDEIHGAGDITALRQRYGIGHQ